METNGFHNNKKKTKKEHADLFFILTCEKILFINILLLFNVCTFYLLPCTSNVGYVTYLKFRLEIVDIHLNH